MVCWIEADDQADLTAAAIEPYSCVKRWATTFEYKLIPYGARLFSPKVIAVKDSGDLVFKSTEISRSLGPS